MTDPHSSPWEAWLNKWFIRLLIPAILVNASGLFIRIMEPDGALYAVIARAIAETGDFVNLRVEGKDWLDKPHFPFWMAAISFRIFGISSFAYKLPALLFWAAGGWYIFRIAKDIYGRGIAQLSVLIYVSAAHLVISNNDVRAEPYLTGLVIGAVYHFYKASRVRPGRHLAAGALLAACAVMTKGPFVLVTIGGGFILDWIIRKDWAQFVHPRWWLALLLTGVCMLPELYCLYVQFDLHPEKLVFGRTGVSGIRWFFWDSQFGRFFNNGPIRGSGEPFFYFHTLLWAFLPWSLVLYAGVIRKITRLSPHAVAGNGIFLGSALLSFAMFSLSRFQLPHYLNILFPFFSILSADYLYSVRQRAVIRGIVIVQWIIICLLPALVLMLCWLYHFPAWSMMAVVVLFLSLLPFRLLRGHALTSAVGRSFWMAMVVFLFVNCCLYPSVLQYQAGMLAGDYIRRQVPDCRILYMPVNGPDNFSIEFWTPAPVRRFDPDSLHGRAAYYFVKETYADTLVRNGHRVERLERWPNFHISQLTGEFLNYKTRARTVEWMTLVRLNKP